MCGQKNSFISGIASSMHCIQSGVPSLMCHECHAIDRLRINEDVESPEGE
jgi:hypothetical protein